MIESISAVTLATYDMRRAVRFYTVSGASPLGVVMISKPNFAAFLA